MERVSTAEEVRSAVAAARCHEDRTVALVPTKGALHDGHVALVHAACTQADVVVVSDFVNPRQFGPAEDFEAYPRDIDRDLDKLRAAGVDVVFTPSVEEMYAEDDDTVVEPGPMGMLWEGETRPGHFEGVCTVVVKLLDIVAPDLAFFGSKDYQQLVIVRKVARELDIATRIVGFPIVREPGGLALSSRNAYLSPEEHVAAHVLSRALFDAAEAVTHGEADAAVVAAGIEAAIATEPLATLDYAAVVDPETLLPVESIHRESRALLAVRFPSARLIDNVALVPPSGLQLDAEEAEAWLTSSL